MLSTPEDYLTLEREADTRREFLDGEIYVMVAGESLPPQPNLYEFGA
jgi:Uma2 family endonuclease